MSPRYKWPMGTEPVRAVTGRKLHLRRLGIPFTICGIKRLKKPTEYFLETKDRCLTCWKNA